MNRKQASRVSRMMSVLGVVVSLATAPLSSIAIAVSTT